MTEEILIDLKIPGAEDKIDALTQSINDLNAAQKALIAENKELEKTGEQNSKQYLDNARQIELNKQKIQENTASRKGLVQAMVAEDGSIKSLRVSNAELIKQRDLISTKTDAGRAKIQEINKQLDANNEKIKENVSKLEQQKINIGNYASALDGVVPGLGRFVSGIQGATNAARAFIATPIGLIIGALGLALGALISYFKGSEEGQNRLNKIVAIGTGIFERFMDVVEFIGEQVFDKISEKVNDAIAIFDAFTSALGLNTNAVSGFFNELAQEAQRFADLQAAIDEQERTLILNRAETNLKVAKLRERAVKEEGDIKRKTIEEAIALEKQLVKQEVELAKLRAEQAVAEQNRNGDDKEAKLKTVEALAAVTDARAKEFEATLRFQKELEKLRDADNKKIEENNKKALEESNKRIAQFEKESEIRNDVADSDLERDLERINESFIAKEEDKEREIELEENFTGIIEENYSRRAQYAMNYDDLLTRLIQNGLTRQQAAAAIQSAQAGEVEKRLNSVTAAFGRQTVAYKIAASAQAVANTWKGVTQIISEESLLPFPASTIAKAIAIAGTIATGFNAVRNINAAAGGGNFVTKGPTMLLVGDNPGGVEHISVTPISGKGTTRVVQGSGLTEVRAAGGINMTAIGSNETRIAASNANNQFDPKAVASLMDMVKIVLVRESYEVAQMQENERVALTKVI